MNQIVEPFSDEQNRLLINLSQTYEVWCAARRDQAALPYGMRWRASAGQDYLIRVLDRQNNATSLGPRSPQTERILAAFEESSGAVAERVSQSSAVLEEMGRQYRALRLPMIAAEAGKILREADVRGLLSTSLLAIGTNAVAAYQIEAAARIVGIPEETNDFDM